MVCGHLQLQTAVSRMHHPHRMGARGLSSYCPSDTTLAVCCKSLNATAVVANEQVVY